jgi:CPA1 family monovalent cation:H+ antiporter
VVVFLVIYEMLTGELTFHIGHVGWLLLQEAVGGIILGLILGWITYHLIRSIDNYQVEVLLTLALVTGGYSLASALHMSGPLAIVAAGLLIGNRGRLLAMSDKTREHLDTFWELIDEILNAVLFVLIGLELLVLTLSGKALVAGLAAIPIVLLARFVSVGVPVACFRRWRSYSPHVVKIMTWGGLRGAISVALALSLPSGPERALLLTMTYVVVVFSILVQGLTVPKLLRQLLAKQPQPRSTPISDME